MKEETPLGDLRRNRTPREQADIDRWVEQASRALTLRKLREAAGITQTQLAEELHVRQSHISQMENRADIQVGTLAEFVDALGGDLELIAHIGGKQYTIVIPTMVGVDDGDMVEAPNAA